MTSNDKPKRPGSKPFLRDRPMSKREDAGPVKAAPSKLTKAEMPEGAERISKVMARAGVASRRDIERMIMEGRVRLNGVVLDSPVINVTLADRIEVDGVPIRGIERTRLWLYHKPAGLVTTNADPEGRPTVFDNLPEELPRVMSIGRLDINTEGLLLLSNDGGLARVLELPTTGWLRRYRVRAHGEIDQDALDKLKDGIAVEGVLYGSIEATLDKVQGSNVWITMGLREGKNREIKNVLGALGLEVNRLIRISYGPFQLGELPEGQVIEVRGRTLRDQLGPRLVEDAKANFDAPLYNTPAVSTDEDDGGEEDHGLAARPQKRERPGDKRERALSRLDTKREDKRGAPRGKDEGKPKRAPLPTPRRSANVWMAPGARPLGEKAAAKAAKNAEKYGPSTRGPRPRPGADRPDEGPRTRINRVDDSEGEWIRASEDTGGTGRRRDDGDRPERGARPFREGADHGAGRFGDKPRGTGRSRLDGDDRPERRERSAADRGRSERAPRAEGDRPFRAKSATGDSARPKEGKPFGKRGAGGKPSGGKPGGKGFSGRPRGEGGGGRPSGGAPRGGPKGRRG
jgi:23S rRNA pseudouridine2605 synthase